MRARLWILGIAAGAFLVALRALEQAMWDAGGPGIIGFQLAGTEENADRILREWDEEAEDAARLSLWLDFAFLVVYGAFWYYAARAVGRNAAAVAAIGAAAADALENIALLVVLGGDGGAVAPALAAGFAVAKFVLIGCAIGAVLLTLAWRRPLVAAALLTVAFGAVLVAVVVIDGRTESGAEPLMSEASGDEDRPALVLVHGFSVDHTWWDLVVPELSDRFRVVRVDLLGHGDSPKPRDGYGMEDQADRVAAALREEDLGGATVVGHSMGGAVAVALAERHPALVDRLMVIGTGPEVGQDGEVSLLTPAFLPISGHLIRAFAPDDSIRWQLETTLIPEVDLSPRQVEGADATTWQAFQGSASAMGDYSRERPLDQRVKRLDVPFLAVFGTDDDQGDEADRYPRVRRLRGLGHSPMIERPAQTARVIARFARGGG